MELHTIISDLYGLYLAGVGGGCVCAPFYLYMKCYNALKEKKFDDALITAKKVKTALIITVLIFTPFIGVFILLQALMRECDRYFHIDD